MKPAAKDTRRQFDFFVPNISDLPLRDRKDTMERPFFSLKKNKRLKPIDYVSPDGKYEVRVAGHQDHGMATIWDADILIWAASVLNNKRERGENDLPRTLYVHPHNLLKAIGRDAKGGDHYDRLRAALNRLAHTAITTNIRITEKKKKYSSFHWIEGWDELKDEASGDSKGMEITLSDWVYKGIVEDRDILAIHPAYFDLQGGLERWLYRVARKHAGRQDGGFTLSLTTLYEKSGVEDNHRKFKAAIKKIVAANCLPEYWLTWIEETANGDSALHMVGRDKLPADHPGHAVFAPHIKTLPVRPPG
jgi:plasmid replication initiation protein